MPIPGVEIQTESRSEVTLFLVLSQQNRRLLVQLPSDADKKRQSRPICWQSDPPPPVRSYRWNQTVAMTTGQVTVTVVPPDVQQVLKCSRFLWIKYFFWLSLWGKSITSQPATKQISTSSCGDYKTISLLFQFRKNTTTLLCMLNTPESCHSALNGLRTWLCVELHTPRYSRLSLEQDHGLWGSIFLA